MYSPVMFLNIEFEYYKLTSNFHYNEKRYKRAALYKYAYMSEVMNLCELYKSYTSIHVYIQIFSINAQKSLCGDENVRKQSTCVR